MGEDAVCRSAGADEAWAGDLLAYASNRYSVASPMSTIWRRLAFDSIFADHRSVGYSGNILVGWKAQSGQRWTVSLGASIGKVVWLGPLPVQIQLGGQYFVERPTGGPAWNVQLQLTPVIPRLIKKTLFQ